MKLDGISEELKETIIRGEKELREQLNKTGFWSFKKDKIYNAIMKYEIERARQETLADKYNSMIDEKDELQNKVAKLDSKAAKPVNDKIKSLNKKLEVLGDEVDRQTEKTLALQPDWEKAGKILDKRLEEVEKREQKRNNRR